jgi:hypothetical protein
MADEVRVSNPVRNASWINTSYLNQYDPDSFFDVGVEETGPSGDVNPPVISDVNAVLSDPVDTVIGWVNMSCFVTDNVGVSSVFVNVTFPDGHSENLSMVVADGDVFYYNSTFSDVGSYSFVVWAEDVSGNVNSSGVGGFVIAPNWDINGDGVCNGLDVTFISINWLNTGSPGWIGADINNDGAVNGLDVTFISIYWLEMW